MAQAWIMCPPLGTEVAVSPIRIQGLKPGKEWHSQSCQANKKLARHNDYIPWFTPLVIKTAAFGFGNDVSSVMSQLHRQCYFNLRL